MNPQNKEIEIDIYCIDPLVIAECTSFLKENELEKVRRFVKTKDFVHELVGREPKSYFFCYSIADSILKQVVDLLADANIDLICIKN